MADPISSNANSADAVSLRSEKVPLKHPRQQPTGAQADPATSAALDEPAVRQELARELLLAQSQVLNTLARDASLSEMLGVFAETIERQSPDMLCSILLLEDQNVRHGAAPSLPSEYNAAVDGLVIGPQAGSCGTAAFTRRQVIVTDIASDPLWDDYRELALKHGLRACWSTPILGAGGEVLGTFAMYYRTSRAPTEHDRRLMEIWTQLAALGISRKRAEEAVRREQQLLLHLFKSQEYDRRLAAFELHDGVA